MKLLFERHTLVLVGYSLLVVGLRWRWDASTVWMVSGLVVGYVLVFLDRLVYIYLLHPYEQLSVQVQYLIRLRRWREAVETINQRRGEQTKLAFRSFLFVVAWVFLAVFALTTTADSLAQGVVMGLGLHVLDDLWRDFRRGQELFSQRVFWQVKRPVSEREMKAFLYGFTGVFVVLSWMLI